MSTVYEARLHRIGRWWAIDVPQLDIHTQCRTLDEAEDMARGAIVEALGIRPDTIAVELVVPEFQSLLRSVQEARTHRAAADAAEQQTVSDAARTLIEDLRVSQSDACRLLGISHQQVSQLAPAASGFADSRPWHPGPLSMPSAPRVGVRSSDDTTQYSNGHRQPRTGLANGSSDSSSMMRPKRHRQESFVPPAWAIAEDGA
ncbi:hypothetical protein [Streptomyces sp. NPDC051219]|uniref:hypothetical protein n=1 Tax=Streptomyces sp. NPDC051219 TaxID=3155283 RepID=UPI003416D979